MDGANFEIEKKGRDETREKKKKEERGTSLK